MSAEFTYSTSVFLTPCCSPDSIYCKCFLPISVIQVAI